MSMVPMLAAFGLSGGELILVLVAVLILFGAKKIPDFAKGLGQGIKEFKKASREVQDELERATSDLNPMSRSASRPPPSPVEPSYVEPSYVEPSYVEPSPAKPPPEPGPATASEVVASPSPSPSESPTPPAEAKP